MEDIEKEFALLLGAEMEEAKKNKNFTLSNKGEYIFRVCHYTVTLDTLIEEIDKVIIFSRRFTDSKYYESNNIYMSDYIDYHFEVYVHKIHTILELMKLAVNATFELNILDRDCSWSNIKEQNIPIQIKHILNSYYAYFKDIINLRHANTHRAQSTESLNFIYSGYIDIKKMSKKVGTVFPEDLDERLPEFFIHYELKKYRKEKIKLITRGKEKAQNYIESFSHEMQKEALKRYNNGRLKTYKK